MTTTIILTVALIFQGWFNYKTKQKFKKIAKKIEDVKEDITIINLVHDIIRDEINTLQYAKSKRNNKRSN